MRRLLRILLDLATLAALVLGLAAVVLWGRSYHALDQYRWLDPEARRLVAVASRRGGLHVARVDDLFDPYCRQGGDWQPGWRSTRLTPPPRVGGPPDDDWQLLRGAGPAEDDRRLGFRLVRGEWDIRALNAGGNPRFWSVRIPFWSLAGVALPLPAARGLRRWRRRRRRAEGCCRACGYDLRATPHRCPECGTAADA